MVAGKSLRFFAIPFVAGSIRPLREPVASEYQAPVI